MTNKQRKALRGWLKARNGEIVMLAWLLIAVVADAKPWVLMFLLSLILLVFIIRQRKRDKQRIDSEYGRAGCEEAESDL